MDSSTQVKHPAKFSKPILDILAAIVREEAARSKFHLDVLDPFAGVGGIHQLENFDERINTTGIEIESEWVLAGPPCRTCGGAGGGMVRNGMDQADFDWEDCTICGGSGAKTMIGNALHLPMQWTGAFHVVATSPTYGNRMADHHDAKDDSKRMTYKHVLGHDLHPDNSGQLHFGDKYKTFHIAAWHEVTRVLVTPDPLRVPRPEGGLFILNVSDFIKSRQVVPVCDWHCEYILSLGYDLEQEHNVPTNRLRYGANHSARVTHEKVFAFRRTMTR